MATLYWGGGTGTWDGFTTANWYTDFARLTPSTRAPSAEDDVIFDSVSSATAYTVTIANNTTVCRNVTIAGPASGSLTLAGSDIWYIYGNLTLPATGLTRTYTGSILFYGTGSHTITTNGVAMANTFAFQGSGTYTLQDALTTNQISLNAGTFNTDGKNLTCTTISASTSTSTGGTLTLGASTVSATQINANAPIVINAGTSNITLTSSPNLFFGGGTNYTGNTFNNVTFSASTITTLNFSGNNTFNNLTFTTRSTTGVSTVNLFGNQTVTGTLTIAGQSSVNRYFVRSDTIGTPRTLTVGTVAALTDVDFRDITVAGASAPWSGTRLGNCLGNTNITFGAGANKYIAASTGSSNWSGNIWATSSGGSAATTNFPLAQDTIIIDNAGLNTSATLTLDFNYNVGTLNSSSRTNAMTFSGSDNPSCYGDTNISTNVTSTISGTWTYAGRTTQNITTNGKTWGTVTIDSPSGTVKLLDALNISSRVITLASGTFDANNQNITCGRIEVSGNATKTLTLGSGTISTSTGVFTASEISNLTVTSTTATITCSGNPSIGFAGITATLNGNVIVSGANAICTVYGNTTLANLTLTASTAIIVTKIQLAGNLTVTGTLALGGGGSAIQRANVISTIIGTQRTITAATVTGLTDIDFRDINATGAADWTTGTRLGNCGGNSGITFPAAKTVYWNLAGTQDWSATAWATSSGGTPAVNNFPLAQDTAVFDNTGSIGTVTMQAFNIGTLNASGRTSAMTLSGTGAPTIYGDVTYGSGVTPSNTGAYTFSGRGTQTYTTAGKSVGNALAINKPTGTFQHGDAYTSSAVITVTAGTYTTQNYNISAAGISSNNSNTRSITFGTSTLTLSGASPITFTNSTGLTFSGASSTINLSVTGTKTFAGGGLTFGTVSSTGGTTSPLTITGSNTFGTLTNSARTFMIWAAGTTQTITNFTYSGASGSIVRWYTSIPGQRATIKQSSATAVGTNSVDGGNNSGLTFTGTSPDYFYVKDIAYAANAVLVYISESASVNSSETALATYIPTISESATGSDSIVGNLIFIATINESSTGSDSISANLVALVLDGATASDVSQAIATLASIISEQVQAGDSVSAKSIISAFIEENATASESSVRFVSFNVDISESATSSDQATLFNVFNSAIVEAVSSLDVPAVVASTFAASLAEAVVGMDLINAQGSLYNVNITESAQIDNFMFGAYLWNGISDNPENYTGISDIPATWNVIADNSETWNPVD
jgi:fibronectin-binding autotransporter adhesin